MAHLWQVLLEGYLTHTPAQTYQKDPLPGMQIRENIFGLIGDMTEVRSLFNNPIFETARRTNGSLIPLAGINDLAFSPDSLYMATGADEGLVIIWSIKEVSFSRASVRC